EAEKTQRTQWPPLRYAIKTCIIKHMALCKAVSGSYDIALPLQHCPRVVRANRRRCTTACDRVAAGSASSDTARVWAYLLLTLSTHGPIPSQRSARQGVDGIRQDHIEGRPEMMRKSQRQLGTSQNNSVDLQLA